MLSGVKKFTMLNRELKDTKKILNKKILAKYPELSIGEIKHLLFDEKWMARLTQDINNEIESVINASVSRLVMIAKRYAMTLGEIDSDTDKSREAVRNALKGMGYQW